MSATDGTPTATGKEEALAEVARRRASGVLTLDELVSAVHRVRGATSEADVAAAVAALPPAGDVTPARRLWGFSVLGGGEQRGRWVAPRSLRHLSLLGGAEIDLGRACVVGDEVSITCIAILGGMSVLAPPGIPVTLSGFSLLGGRSDERSASDPLPGAPLVRMRVVTILGGASVSEAGFAGVALEATDDALVLRLGGVRRRTVGTPEIRVPYSAVRSVRLGAAGPGPTSPFGVRQGGRLALFRDRERAITLEVDEIAAGRGPVTEIAVQVDDPQAWLAEIARRRGEPAGG